MEFSTISQIRVEAPETWEGKLFLTFDIDWAHDDVVGDVIDLVESADVSATWFITHRSKVLDRLQANPNFEIGVHPNFNPLLLGDTTNGTSAAEVLERIKAIVPEATSVRSHSLAQGSLLQQEFSSIGLTHDCNLFIPEQAEFSEIRPFKLWNGMISVPYFFCDYCRCIYSSSKDMSDLTAYNGLKVFDFHPIHVFLNTENLVRYDDSRSLHQRPSELIAHRSSDSRGSREQLKQLLHIGGRKWVC